MVKKCIIIKNLFFKNILKFLNPLQITTKQSIYAMQQFMYELNPYINSNIF